MKLPCCLFVSVFIFTVCGGADDACADFLDFLFGGRSDVHDVPVVPAVPAVQPRIKVRHAAAKHRAVAVRKAKPKPQIAAPPQPMPEVEPDAERLAGQLARGLTLIRKLAEIARDHGVEAAFMLDPTLRAGDIVVTHSGLHVYEGNRAELHRPNQFRTLANSELRNRVDLRLLQKIGRYSAPTVTRLSMDQVRPLTISRSAEPAARLAEPKSGKAPIVLGSVRVD